MRDATIEELEASKADIEHDIELLKKQIKENRPYVYHDGMNLTCPREAAYGLIIQDLQNRKADIELQIKERTKS